VIIRMASKRIKNIIVTVVSEDGSIVSDVIDGEQEFVADLYQNHRQFGSNDHFINAITFLLNMGSKAITGVNPKRYENAIKTHFGDSRNINDMQCVDIIVTKIKRRREDYVNLMQSSKELGDTSSVNIYEQKIHVLDWILSLF
jgi:hypothetical protein